MRKFILVFAFILPLTSFCQINFHKWSFNTKDSLGNGDATVSSGTRTPQYGNGSIQLAGTVINTYSDGVVNDSSSIGDNSAIQLTTFPTNGTKRDTSGIIFKMNTLGYCNLFFSWYQRHSATSSKFVKLLYTIDGVNWNQYTGVGTDTTNNLYRALISNTFLYRTADFSTISGVNNNPLFAVKIVSTFSPNGSSYIGTTSTYATSGTYRFDLVQLKGHPIPSILSPKRLQILANMNGNSIVEGNYKSITNGANENEYYVITGRGPDITQDNLTCESNKIKIDPLPFTKPKIIKIKIDLDSSFYSVLTDTKINYDFRNKIDGYLTDSLAKHKKLKFYTDTITDCFQSTKTSPNSENGYDPNGLVILNQNFWMMDELRTAFVCLSSNNKIIAKYSAFEKDSVFKIDEQLMYTNPGNGFTNLTITPNQLLYSISAKPLFADSIQNSRFHRLISFNPTTKELKTYIVLNGGVEGSILASDWILDEISSVSDDEFLIYEHAQNQSQQIKRISKISIKNATAITSSLYNYNGKQGPVEILENEIGLAANQIIPVTKSHYIDLYKNGLPTYFDQISGMHIQNDSLIILITNNNNGLKLNTNQGAIETAQVNESKIAIFKLTGDLKLSNVPKNNNQVFSLGDFSIDSLLNNQTIIQDSSYFNQVKLSWSSSSGAINYSYSIDTCSSINKASLFKSSLNTIDTNYNLSFDAIKNIAIGLNIQKGDSIPLYLTIWAYNDKNDSLPSSQTIQFYLKSPLTPETFYFTDPTSLKFNVNKKKGNELKLTWSQSKYAESYKLSIDTAINENSLHSALYTFVSKDTIQVLSSDILDSLLNIIGTKYGDSVLLKFRLLAMNQKGYTLQSTNQVHVNMYRENNILVNFSIVSPQTNFKTVISSIDSGIIKIEWEKSEYATGYIVSNSAVNNPAVKIHNVGDVLNYSLSIPELLKDYPIDRGDSVTFKFNVFALYNKDQYNDTLKSSNEIKGTIYRDIKFDTITLIAPAPFVQYNIGNLLVNQSDSVVFGWKISNPFAAQVLKLISENMLDSFQIALDISSENYSISKAQLYSQFLNNKAFNDSVFVNWFIINQYKNYSQISSTRKICLKKIETTGLNEMDVFNKFKLYPNPVLNGEFYLNTNGSNIINVKLFNQLGQLVHLVITDENGSLKLNTMALPGIYYLKIQLEQQTVNFPIIFR